MGYERRVMRTILSVLLVLVSIVTVYGDRDSTFMQQKFRNRVQSPQLQKWRESELEGVAASVSEGAWREQLLSNLRNVLRQHSVPSSKTATSQMRDIKPDVINPYVGLQDSVKISANDLDPTQLFLLDRSSTPMEMESYASIDVTADVNDADEEGDERGAEKRNGFFFGKRNGFFFGKRSGRNSAVAAASKVDSERMLLPKYDSKLFDEAVRSRRGGALRGGRHLL